MDNDILRNFQRNMQNFDQLTKIPVGPSPAVEAAIKTATYTQETAEKVAILNNEIRVLNSQVTNLSLDLETERARIKQLEKEKVISEYSGKIPALFWSLLAFIVTISIFYFENDNISSKASIFLLVALIIIHIGAIIYNFIKMRQAKKGDENT